MRYCVKLSGSAVIESSRLVAITDRLTYACKMLPPSEIITCRSLCVKCLLDRTLHLRQTRLPGLLSSHMVVESPSVSAVSQKCAEQYSRAMSNEKRPPIPLLPKQPDSRFESRMYIIDPQLRESSVTSESSLKRVQVQAACVPCHKRKTRVCQRVSWHERISALTFKQCDSNRPSCARCAKNEILCRYDVEPNTSRFASMQRKNESLQYELDLLQKLVVHIRTSSTVDVEDTVRHIRAGADPLDIARSLSTI
jgi:hypothetical protein